MQEDTKWLSDFSYFKSVFITRPCVYAMETIEMCDSSFGVQHLLSFSPFHLIIHHQHLVCHTFISIPFPPLPLFALDLTGSSFNPPSRQILSHAAHSHNWPTGPFSVRSVIPEQVTTSNGRRHLLLTFPPIEAALKLCVGVWMYDVCILAVALSLARFISVFMKWS